MTAIICKNNYFHCIIYFRCKSIILLSTNYCSRRSPLNIVVTVNLTIACISMAAVLYDNSCVMKYLYNIYWGYNLPTPGKKWKNTEYTSIIYRCILFVVYLISRENRRQCTSLCELIPPIQEDGQSAFRGLDIAKGGLTIALGKWNIF